MFLSHVDLIDKLLNYNIYRSNDNWVSMKIIHIQWLYQLLPSHISTILIQSKCLSVQVSHVLVVHQLHQILLQFCQFGILPLIERKDGNSIIQLKTKRIHTVIHQNCWFYIPIQYPHILHVYVLIQLDTVLTIQPMFEYLSIWIQLI